MQIASLSLSSAVTSGLSDEVSDREGGKTTVVTQLGNARARGIAELSVVLGAVAWAAGSLAQGASTAGLFAPACIAVLWGARGMWRHGPGATTRAFAEQARYKQALHHAIWGGALLAAAALLAQRAIG